MDKGIIIGAEHEAATRSNLPFVMFRHSTSVGTIFCIPLVAAITDTVAYSPTYSSITSY